MVPPSRRDELPDAGESRAAVALTVVWMLTCLATAVGLAVVFLLRGLMVAFPVAAGGDHPLARMAGVMLFVSVATGLLCLVFTPLALRVRQTPPPRSITVAAVVIGVLPLVVVAFLAA